MKLKYLTYYDYMDVYYAKNHPDAVETGDSGKRVSLVGHKRWWSNFRRSALNGFLGIYENGEFAGYIRFQHAGSSECELSWFLYPKFRGNGYAAKAIEKVIKDKSGCKFKARIKKDNKPSLKLANKFPEIRVELL